MVLFLLLTYQGSESPAVEIAPRACPGIDPKDLRVHAQAPNLEGELRQYEPSMRTAYRFM